MKPGTADVLELLRNRGEEGVTALTALAYLNCFRLGARIWELKQDGYPIETTMVETSVSKKRIAKYVLREQTRLDRIGREEFVAEMELGLV